MNKEAIIGLIVVLIISTVIFFVGVAVGKTAFYKEIYTKALSDVYKKRPLEYTLVEQENGEKIWQMNQSKEKN